MTNEQQEDESIDSLAKGIAAGINYVAKGVNTGVKFLGDASKSAVLGLVAPYVIPAALRLKVDKELQERLFFQDEEYQDQGCALLLPGLLTLHFGGLAQAVAYASIAQSGYPEVLVIPAATNLVSLCYEWGFWKNYFTGEEDES